MEQNHPNNQITSQTYDPSIQYQYDYQQQQQNPYSYQSQYYPQHPSSYPYYPQVEDSSSYPPGVSVAESNVPVSSNEVQNQQNGYYYNYPNAGIAGLPVPSNETASYGPTPSIANMHVKPKAPKMKSQKICQSAWCELCKVDCNSLEMFENHKKGKKHQKNLRSKAVAVGQTEIPSQIVKQLPLDDSSGVAVGSEVKTEEEKVNIKEGPAAKKRKKKSGPQNGEGVKWVKSDDGSKMIRVEPQKPEVVPLICELCNVKCESPVVFQTHLVGKKHLSNLQRLQSQQAIGQAAIQALYPALQSLFPALQALAQGDMSTLVSELQQQGYLGPDSQPIVPPNHFQGQGSEEIPPSEIPQQQSDLPLEFVTTTGAKNPQQQSDLPLEFVTTTEAKNDEQSGPVSTIETKNEEQSGPVSTIEAKNEEQSEPVSTGDAESEALEDK